jgi:hypothetical protein
MLFQPPDEGARVVTITPQQRDAGTCLFQPLHHRTPCFLIGALGTEHGDGQEMALRINEQVAFAPPDFFSPRRSPSRDHEPHSS